MKDKYEIGLHINNKKKIDIILVLSMRLLIQGISSQQIRDFKFKKFDIKLGYKTI